MNTIEFIEKYKVIVIARGLTKEQALKSAEALYDGGIRLLEVTFDPAAPTSESADIISVLAENFEGKMLIGAGTVVREDQLIAAYEAGAKYIISPNTDTAIIKKTKELGLVSIPGALTPSEIVSASAAGADFVKIFPVTAFGDDYIKQVRAPLSNIKLLVVGGVDEHNMNSYIRQGAVGIGIGSNILNKKLIANGEYDKICELAKVFSEGIEK